MDYNSTLNLPKTDFPMRAGLPKLEPGILQKWEDERLYDSMIGRNRGKPLYLFHDGPPYANADIHLGHALNKSLKDFIVRYKNMSGFLTNYIPGWDTHGLPIELLAIKKLGLNVVSDPVEFRRRCHEFALSNVENQKKQLKRLGTLANYDNPYLTLRPEFEAQQIEVFGVMAKKGYIYKDLKSVLWCPECATALAEAEIEYSDDPCDSIYVKFPVKDDNGTLARMGIGEGDLPKTYVVIWTTTTWTLPANLCTCLGPGFEYVIVNANGEYLLMASELADATMNAAGIKDYKIMGSAQGSELEHITYNHPFLDRECKLILGDHVTLETGTGCVHTAPGHGVEDFDVVMKHYPELGCVVPVDNYGKMTAEAGDFIEGQSTDQANKTILERLKADNYLLAVQKITHSYPHCWRCRQPVLFRATEQWFCSVEDFKAQTLEQIEGVKFYPDWGKERLASMVEGRSAWCISRQRTWGVPIPVFYCGACGKYIITDESITAVAQLFAVEGSDAWYKKSAADILPAGFSCPHCADNNTGGFTKETDIMDVWFDSGCTHAAVMGSGKWPDQGWPCDLYLEGSDQHRGWFQSSLLTAVAWKGKAPYKEIVTCGWVVDGEGRKMSKSLGNGIDPIDVINEYGADILRLWVSSTDYHSDVRISKDILKQLSDIYRKIRNTARFILGNLDGFDPDAHSVADDQLTELDRWALMRLDDLLIRCTDAYDGFEFHMIYHSLQSFCTIDMSNFYLDIIKDRLYVEREDSIPRRAAQTAMWRILRTVNLLIAPILAFTAEEIWGYLPHSKDDDTRSVMFNDIPKPTAVKDDAFTARWDEFIAVRDDVNKALELARTDKRIGKSLEASVGLYISDEALYERLSADVDLLRMLLIVSDVKLHRGEDNILISAANGGKCERCWTVSTSVGDCARHPTLCERCVGIVG
ncbi:MAG: isoleucine--tRNA ligase [Oscillospiraceae bacterium]|nr:isoleucine--tRNA ligase [Oscillospiraceae bacterium]